MYTCLEKYCQAITETFFSLFSKHKIMHHIMYSHSHRTCCFTCRTYDGERSISYQQGTKSSGSRQLDINMMTRGQTSQECICVGHMSWNRTRYINVGIENTTHMCRLSHIKHTQIYRITRNISTAIIVAQLLAYVCIRKFKGSQNKGIFKLEMRILQSGNKRIFCSIVPDSQAKKHHYILKYFMCWRFR